MKKRLRQLRSFLERRNRVSIRAAPEYRACHPVIEAEADGVTVTLCVSGTPSDNRRDALNTERDLRKKFRAAGVELERRP